MKESSLESTWKLNRDCRSIHVFKGTDFFCLFLKYKFIYFNWRLILKAASIHAVREKTNTNEQCWPPQHCKAKILQLKTNKINENKKNNFL